MDDLLNLSDDKPLQGRRVAVTRASHQAEELARPLRLLGAEVVLCPMLEAAPMRDTAPLRQALVADLTQFDFAFVTSANGALALRQFCEHEGLPMPLAGGPKFVGIGAATAQALASFVENAGFLHDVKNARDLLARVATSVSGRRVIVFQGDTADASFREGLSRAGAQVTAVQVYRMAMPQAAEQSVRELLAGPPLDAVTFASGLTAENFFYALYRCGITPPEGAWNGLSEQAAVAALPYGTVLAAIGSVTADVMTRLGHTPQVTAAQPTVASLARALGEFFRRRG